jgi:hypothetical protein
MRPPILGLIKHPAQSTEIQRNNARIGVALHAHREGFALVKTIELHGDDRADAVALKDLTDVAASRHVTAVVVSGLGRNAPAVAVAQRAGLRVMALPILRRRVE